jgi:hypothetical protein
VDQDLVGSEAFYLFGYLHILSDLPVPVQDPHPTQARSDLFCVITFYMGLFIGRIRIQITMFQIHNTAVELCLSEI